MTSETKSIFISKCLWFDLRMSNFTWVLLVHQVMLASRVGATCNTSIKMTDLQADIVIGGLFPVHYYSSHATKYTLNSYALTWIEAFHFAIKSINNDPTLLPGIRLGYDIRDSCNDERHALRHALDFILDLSYFKGSKNRTVCTCEPNQRNKLMAVVGGASSSVSVAISHLLGVHFVPQVSYSSTSVVLRDKNRYRSFLRTLPSDLYQAKALADFIQHFNWTFINILASDDDYGRLGSDELRKELIKRNICMAVDRTFPSNITKSEAQKIIMEIMVYKGKANVVVLWCEVGSAKTILAEANAMGLDSITWIGTESWGNNVDLFTLDESIIHGLIGIKPMIHEVSGFQHHLQTLPQAKKHKNPWLSLYWKEVFKCGHNATKHVQYHLQNDADYQVIIKCPDGSVAGNVLPLNKYPNVMSAVYSIAHGLHASLNCTTSECTKPVQSVREEDLLRTIKQLSFDLPGSSMKTKFDENGDLLFASYTFANLIVDAAGFRRFEEIGYWDGEERYLDVLVDKIQWNRGKQVPSSRCSVPCKPGQYKIGGRQPCCWECASCQPDHITTFWNAKTCIKCPALTISNANHTACLRLKTTTISFFSPSGALVAGFVGIGVVVTTFIVCVLFKFWSTPVVKSSNRELSMLQLCCIFLLSCSPFTFYFDVTKVSCVVYISWFGILLTIVIGVVFTKTYRLRLIFKKLNTEDSKLLRNSYQALLVVSLVLIQIVILGAWYLFYNPNVSHEINRSTKTVVLHCGAQEEILFFVILGLIFIIMLCSAYMAFKARNLPEGFNEARCISFAMFINSISWLSYVPVYFSIGTEHRYIFYCCIICFTNLITLLLLYGNKVKIMLFYPELNTTAQYRRNTAHSTLQSVLRIGDLSKSSSVSVASFQVGSGLRDNSISSTRLSPSLNRRLGVRDNDSLASSIILGVPSKVSYT